MRYKKMKKGVAVLAAGALLTLSITGCSTFGSSSNSTTSSNTTTTAEAVDLNNLFSDRDLDASYDASSPRITFTDESITSESDSAKVSGNTVTITAAGTYILSGSSKDAQVVVEVGENDKVQLVFENLTLASSRAAAVYVKQADKVFVTLPDGTTNSISTEAASKEQDDSNVDGAIFSKDDLTINGNGTLNVTSTQTNGIVGKDDVRIVSGTININSGNHAVDANDNISVKDPTINVEAGKDGLHCDGNVNVVGGDININKCVEGIEGQVINMAGGDTYVVSSDDALNATTKDSTDSTTTNNNDPMAVDNNAVLNISAGKLTVNANGDGLDSNGAINISGGETYVSGPTNDGNTAIDFGSGCYVTGGTLVAAGSSGMVEAISSESTQGVMTVNASSNSGTVTLTDSSGNKLAEYTPEKTYACVTISSPGLTVGETYKVTCGSTSEDVTLSSTVTSNVQSSMMGGGMKGGMGGNAQGMHGQSGDSQSGTMQTPPDMNSNSKSSGSTSGSTSGNTFGSTSGNTQSGSAGSSQGMMGGNGNMQAPPDMNSGNSQGSSSGMRGGNMPNMNGNSGNQGRGGMKRTSTSSSNTQSSGAQAMNV